MNGTYILDYRYIKNEYEIWFFFLLSKLSTKFFFKKKWLGSTNELWFVAVVCTEVQKISAPLNNVT